MAIANDMTREVVVSRQSPREERQAALHQIYLQVLERQPYQYERKILARAEEDFLRDKIGVRRFLKILGHSEVYLNEFYYKSSNLKFLELCFKHFMGRAPRDHAEVRIYCDILMREGVELLITRMIDSEEYRNHFGCFTVPHPCQEDKYASPKAFLESQMLLHELYGRRGWIVPTMTWHELQLDCDGGQCQVATHTAQTASNPTASTLNSLHSALNRMTKADLAQFAATLSETERAKLQQVLLQSVH